jgi:hypothetical protein
MPHAELMPHNIPSVPAGIGVYQVLCFIELRPVIDKHNLTRCGPSLKSGEATPTHAGSVVYRNYDRNFFGCFSVLFLLLDPG